MKYFVLNLRFLVRMVLVIKRCWVHIVFQLCLPLYICTLHHYVHISVCPYIPDPVRLGLEFKIFVGVDFGVPVIVAT